MEKTSPRYTCRCDAERAQKEGDQYVYKRQTVLELPAWSLHRKRKLREGLSTTVCVDGCIVESIKQLWEKGIETTGCCCGHNYMRGWVSVHPGFYEDMFKLGYEQRPVDVIDGHPMGLYTFYL